MYQIKLFTILLISILIIATTAYPFRNQNQYMEIKLKPKPIQVEVDNPDNVEEMIVKDITNQKRVLIVAKNPAKFDNQPNYEDRYEVNGKSNADAIRNYYENANKQRNGYWQGSVHNANIN